jgi:putative addiction module component (TIGR02574 family)
MGFTAARQRGVNDVSRHLIADGCRHVERRAVEFSMADAARILEEALMLSANERARLAHELIHSLEPEDLDATAAWCDEVRKRVDEIEAGTVALDDWATVKARLEGASRT